LDVRGQRLFQVVLEKFQHIRILDDIAL
jgi:hypothetical protein